MDKSWDFVGNAWAVEMLQQHILHDAVRHAYLFTSPPGVGRTTLALRLVQALNCPGVSADAIPCGTCKTCRQINDRQYADLTIVEAEKAGGVLIADQVRSLRQSLVLKPYQGRYRVVLFKRFQEANPQASNALLKMLEEAPAHALLLLTADTPEQLLPTITSRCEILRLRALTFEEVKAHLIEKGADNELAHQIAHVSGGRPGYALGLLKEELAKQSNPDMKTELDFRQNRLDDMQEMFRSGTIERFAYAEEITRRKKKNDEAEERIRDTLLVWLSFFRDVLLVIAGGDKEQENICNIDRITDILSLAATLSLEKARRLVSDAGQAIDRLEHNVNARLLIEVLLLDWPRVQSQ
jgi:DNA polymerase-3 subunit delta'